MTTRWASEASWPAAADVSARGLLVILYSVRAYALAFSVPYLWLWTEGLHVVARLGVVLTHASAVLVMTTANDSLDHSAGHHRRLELLRRPEWTRPELVVASAPLITLVAVAGATALLAVDVHPGVPLSIAGVVIAGWVGAHLPLSVKYLGFPEVGAPAVMLVVPAIALRWLTPADPPLLSIVAGVGLLVAIVLATHLRDRDVDLAADVPTSATRRPATTSRWLWVTGLGSGVAVLGSLYRPLGLAGWVAVLGVAGVVAALPLRRRRVVVLTAAHGLIALHWLLG